MRKAVLKKQQEVEQLAKKFSEAKTIIAFDYPGLTVQKFTELRNQLREAGCEVKVYKNNISRRASEIAGIGELAQDLVGAKAIAMGFDDVVAPAKIVNEFAKANKVINIQAGAIEGKVVDAAGIRDLANLPSYEVMLTMLAAGMLTPVRELAIGLNMLVEAQEQN